MSNHDKENMKENHQEKKKKPSWKDMIINGKGTVAEPWPTAEEFWSDPDVLNEIKVVRDAFKNMQNTK